MLSKLYCTSFTEIEMCARWRPAGPVTALLCFSLLANQIFFAASAASCPSAKVRQPRPKAAQIIWRAPPP